MGKLYVRVDDRLIHGQTIVAWCPTLGIQEIIAVDDVSAANPMLKSILTMGVPKNYKTGIVTTQEAKELLAAGSDKTRLLIVKFPQKLEDPGQPGQAAGYGPQGQRRHRYLLPQRQGRGNSGRSGGKRRGGGLPPAADLCQDHLEGFQGNPVTRQSE